MDDSSKMCDHMTNFVCGCLETRGGSTSPLAQITPLSPSSSSSSSGNSLMLLLLIVLLLINLILILMLLVIIIKGHTEDFFNVSKVLLNICLDNVMNHNVASAA